MRQSCDIGAITNLLLRALPERSMEHIAPELEPVALQRGRLLNRPNRRVEHVNFVNRGLVSLVKRMRDGRMVEIGAIGIEGMTDLTALWGIDRALLETMVQVPGDAMRLPLDVLRNRMQEDAVLRTLMQHYSRFAFSQLAQSAACNSLHSLEERCCRWLLIAHDSALSDSFPLTHEFLAMMLGVQRAGVSMAASDLRKSGLIEYRHGMVAIANRLGLEARSCECYRSFAEERSALFARHGGNAPIQRA